MKNENLKVVENGLIPVMRNNEGEKLVNARELYEFLEIKQDFSDWTKKQLDSIDAKEGIEFTSLKGKIKIHSLFKNKCKMY